ncbi:carboxymuconolactone decarboxylase family protein [Alteribacillus bidgolensis]|uniref:4-carboxymuconolactone decarboxylase n=1 Tax=Alteribacillus bidgolensis TaxID=930129 RepID=A0A1G8JNI2_9BACI|nr:carboxymuconolactone decarboxylase family protein [Alteribacillus bidgolensis]SDI32745.1 4-carboxymuconolactone decarboxylase [Alteribacillus bidgolensis]
MEQDRFQRGLDKLKEFTSSEEVNHLIESDGLKDIAPDLRKFIVEFAYGDIYTRSGLDNKQRALVTLSSLVTQAAYTQIGTHVKRGITSGLTPEEIIESIMQLIPYIGFPRVQNALNMTKKIFEEHHVMIEEK